MTDLPSTLEALEHRWMRAWMAADKRVLKALTHSHFRMLVGSRPPVILDARSWLDAATTRYRCEAYRFGEVYARSVAGVAVFATRVDLTATMDGKDWSGEVWITDLWRKSTVRRKWSMVERVVARPDDRPDVPAAFRSLQLWR